MALRAGSVGLGREAGLGARRGWTRRRRPLPRPGRPRPCRAGPPSPLPAGPRRPVPSPGRRRRGPTPRGPERGEPAGPRREGGPDTRGGRRRRRLWTRAGPFPWIAPAAAGVAAAPGEPGGCRRGLTSSLPRPVPGGSPPLRGWVSRGLEAGGVAASPPRRRSPAGSAPRAAVFRAAPRLGRRLAADLELVRTRGIRLFN